MDYSESRAMVSRRGLIKSFTHTFVALPFLGMVLPSSAHSSSVFAIRLEVEAVPAEIGAVQFLIRMENLGTAPARLKSIQLFAPGDSTPRKARFDVEEHRTSYSGRMVLERSQYVMALVELSGGSLFHDRRFVSVSAA